METEQVHCLTNLWPCVPQPQVHRGWGGGNGTSQENFFLYATELRLVSFKLHCYNFTILYAIFILTTKKYLQIIHKREEENKNVLL
jgi:hypothetical protein